MEHKWPINIVKYSPSVAVREMQMETTLRSWRDGSTVKSLYYSLTTVWFQHPHQATHCRLYLQLLNIKTNHTHTHTQKVMYVLHHSERQSLRKTNNLAWCSSVCHVRGRGSGSANQLSQVYIGKLCLK